MIESFLTVGRQIITLYLLMVVGFVLGKAKLLDDRGSVALSTLVMYVVSPCMLVVAFQRPLERETLRAFIIVALVALVGTIAASLLEYVTGFLMESLFHVRYWDYSQRPLNLNGYICALSAATWAVFSVVIVSVVNPFVKNYIYMIPLTMADAAAAVLVGFAVVDTGFAVRRALDLRALLESMERYAKELQALHGGLDSINEHVSGMIRDFAAHVDSKQEELAASAKRVTAARDRVREMMDQKRLSLEDGAKERFANFERILNEAASYLPDVSALRKEVEEAKAKYDRQSEELRRTRERRLLRAEHALRNNPTAASRRHKGPFEQLKRIQQHDEEKKHSA